MRWLVLFVVLAALVPAVHAHLGTYESGETGLHASIVTSPEPLEPGTITLVATLTDNGVPLQSEPVSVRITLGKRLVLDTFATTSEQGTLTMLLYVESAGYYDVALSARGQTVTTPVHVHGRMILVIGFLASLAILLAILLDRL